MRISRAVLFSSIIIFLGSCAIQVPPGGGPQDVEAPHLLSSDPPNHSVSFNGNEIRLDFDEYVALNDISTQLIVSPLLKYPPETKIRKRSLYIQLRDTLLENTTYTMNFGEGLTDNNEGNKMENFQFVFSTGPILDSLSVHGRIVNAFDRKSEKGIQALLYRETFDSIPYKERPVYFSNTNDSGYFRINNISPGIYKMIALKESNADYLYAQGEEMIGFPETLIEAESDIGEVEIFREEPNLKFFRAFSEFPGKAVLIFNTAADTVKWKWISDSTKLDVYARSFSRNHDSLNIWYRNVLADSLSLSFDKAVYSDTVSLRLFKKQEAISGRGSKFGLTIGESPEQTSTQHLHLPHLLRSNRPIAASDFSKAVLLEDSVMVNPVITFSDSLKMEISVRHKWKSKTSYSLFIPPATLTDIYGDRNDTVQVTFVSNGENDYGTVNLTFRNDARDPYLLQLVDDQGKFYRDLVTATDSVFDLTFLNPGIYKIKLVHDNNRNGKWDTGNYLEHVQPEKTEFFPESITVRANWDVDIFVNASKPASGKK